MPDRTVGREAGAHRHDRPAGRQITNRAIPDPAAVRPDIDVLGDRELAARAGDEIPVGVHAGSRGEFTVAKDIYVRPNSGWFSDRAVCYLAAGRPVVTMRTGFAKFYPAGRGLFDYANHDEALAAIDAIGTDYPAHSRAARDLAAEY